VTECDVAVACLGAELLPAILTLLSSDAACLPSVSWNFAALYAARFGLPANNMKELLCLVDFLTTIDVSISAS
jgi:hypothetical protein